MKALDNALSDNVAGNCINPINVREALINMVKEADTADDTRKQYLEFLQDTLHKEYLEMLEKEITKAFVYSLPGAGRDAVPELSRPCRGLRQQDQGQGSATRRKSCARRRLPEVDRGADRDHRLGRRRFPPGSDRLPVGGLSARRENRLSAATSRSRKRSRRS